MSKRVLCSHYSSSENIQLSSSLRLVEPAETLIEAKKLAKKLGITRVTDTTWLDKIGVPVFASIRPSAMDGSLCVNAGKGLRPIEAKVGAYMEAIEFAYAEYNFERDESSCILTTPLAMSNQFENFKFIDLCPSYVKKFEATDAIYATASVDINTGATIFIPSELVFYPFPVRDTKPIFGASTNGLCSGNSRKEAILHGIFELIERDIQSFAHFNDESVIIDESSFPPNAKILLDKVNNSGLQLICRYIENEFGICFMNAFLMEPSDEAPIAIATGYGAHTDAEVAMVRAISEAIQSRLTFIHGGRDDIIDRIKYFQNLAEVSELVASKSLRQRALSGSRIKFDSLPNTVHLTIESALTFVLEKLKSRGFENVLVHYFTKESATLQALKVIVPKLECFNPETNFYRVGTRLMRNIVRRNGR